VVTEPDGVRAVIGVTGQFSAVDNLLTGAENLRLMADLRHLGRRAGPRRVTELLERFDLTDAADKPLSSYSGGMRRRLDLAMTLVGAPRLVFLDEPTTGLDPRSRRIVWQIIGELVADGVTIFLATHRFTAFLTDTRGGQLADLEVRHRSHARVEDRIRTGKATGLRNLPCKGYDQNRVWLELSLAAADLLTWAQALCFDGALARCEPAAFRYRVGHVAARLVRTGRCWRLRLDRDWPWAAQLATAFNRLRAAPWPA